MHAHALRITATLASLATFLAIGCGAPPRDEGAESEQSAMKKTDPNDPDPDRDTTRVVQCGGYQAFNPDASFEAALQSLGCSAPQSAYPASAGRSWFITSCPNDPGTMGWLRALVDTDDYYPYYARMNQTGTSLCKQAIPGNLVEIIYDPDCTGSNCGGIKELPL